MSRKLYGFLIFITLFSLVVRLYRLGEPNHYYFDEVYHVVTARGYANNNPAAYDPFSSPPEEKTAYDWLHPPLAKLIQAGSIKLFGDDPIAWRLPSAIFGAAIIPLVFLLALLMFGPVTAVFSASVIAFENLNLAMSRITMNDIFLTLFVVASFIFTVLYDRQRKFKYKVVTVIFLGLAVASKWTGIWALAVVATYIIFSDFKKRTFKIGSLLLFILPGIIYLASYGQFWIQGHSFADFLGLHKQIWSYQNRRDLEHAYGTTPLFCVPNGLNGPRDFCPWILDARGVYFSFEGYGQKAGYIYALGNPLVFWFGAGAVIYLLKEFIKKRSQQVFLILAAYFVFWVPWIFSPRILFLHHYLPSIPFLSIALGLALAKIWEGRYRFLAVAVVATIVLTFFYFYPISSGYPIAMDAIDRYMWLKSWR
ncbi:phospholipid carrier-dependent glycosyltransferase [Candidatus Curtissbacteria bacterium]|nr:phospholipid carrier-dependent glycosyltransferase [Candidatus Curtissbacteria bacterium]